MWKNSLTTGKARRLERYQQKKGEKKGKKGTHLLLSGDINHAFDPARMAARRAGSRGSGGASGFLSIPACAAFRFTVPHSDISSAGS